MLVNMFFSKNTEKKATLFFHIYLRERIYCATLRATVFYIVFNARNAATL